MFDQLGNFCPSHAVLLKDNVYVIFRKCILPSGFIPTSKHFFNRQLLHTFRHSIIREMNNKMSQAFKMKDKPFITTQSPPKRHEYCLLLQTLLRKNPLKSLIVLTKLRQSHFASIANDLRIMVSSRLNVVEYYFHRYSLKENLQCHHKPDRSIFDPLSPFKRN